MSSQFQPSPGVLEIRESTTFSPEGPLQGRIVVRASNIVVDGRGAELVGPGADGGREALARAGVGIAARGCRNVVLRNFRVSGFRLGLHLEDCDGWSIEHCDFSDNFTDPDFGWGEQEPGGGLLLERVRWTVVRECRANRVWDGIHLRHCSANLILRNDFSRCTNVCAKLWDASNNVFLENDLSYGIRIDRAAGEVHARDSSSILIESGSNDNLWYRNRAVGGGDGVFLRPLNGWVSVRNVFVENDASDGNNNCFESWSPDNVYIRNVANRGSYGFWLGGSDGTVLLGNEASGNGSPGGNHNAPEPVFGHGGIVIVSGTASNVLAEGNRCEHNHGGGIVGRGDVRNEPPRFRCRNWVVQDNRLSGNRWGLHLDRALGLFQAANDDGNEQPDWFGRVDAASAGLAEAGPAPIVRMETPARIDVGMVAHLSAEGSCDPEGRPLRCLWMVGDEILEGERAAWAPTVPGGYDVGLRVDNGRRASLGWSRIVVSEGLKEEYGTEKSAAEWRSTGSHRFSDASESVEGRYSLALRGLAGEEGQWAFYEAPANAEGTEGIRLWVRYRNENVFSWKDWTLRLRLVCDGGSWEWCGTPLLAEWFGLGSNRNGWFRVEAPFEAASALFERTVVGHPSKARVARLELAFCSHGEGPYTVWLDGLSFGRCHHNGAS
ncbi:MAG: right-handed parallel beta-helix repeat-containing protein [Fimbriimonadales bacterium]|nr:right-handed parallel beta-helix repeat-containing protein [Fimbriimonadales bacterium]